MMRNLSVLILSVVAAGAWAQSYQAGKHYQVIDPPVRTQAGSGEVEVVEVFSYACPHCYRFLPHIDQWLQDKPGYVSFRRVPAQFNSTFKVFAQAYVTADMLDLVDDTSHEGMFAAIHEQQRGFRSMEDIAEFYAEHGGDKERFLSTADSFAVVTRMNREADDTRDYGIRGTPSLVVAGKYLISGDRQYVPTHSDMIKVMDYLVRREHQAGNESAAASE